MDKIFKYNDETNQGIINRSTPYYESFDSEWYFENNNVICKKFLIGKFDMFTILKDKTNYDYNRSRRAWNRHKIEAEKYFGIYIEKKKHKVETERVFYHTYYLDKIDEAVIKKGGKSISHYRNPTKTKWTEEKEKLVNEYNILLEESKIKLSELHDKIFKEKELR